MLKPTAITQCTTPVLVDFIEVVEKMRVARQYHEDRPNRTSHPLIPSQPPTRLKTVAEGCAGQVKKVPKCYFQSTTASTTHSTITIVPLLEMY